VFLSTVAGRAFSLESGISAAHMPEIFHVKEIYNVSVFRDPSDAIASLINKNREHAQVVEEDGRVDEYYFNYSLDRSIKTYINYLDSAEANFDNIQVVPFDDLSKDYRAVINQISIRYPLPIKEGYEEELDFSPADPMWSDKFDGHLPREKDSVRLGIERLVSESNALTELSDRYRALIERARH